MATALYPQKRSFTAESPNDLFPELAGKTYFGHGDCGCVRCMDASLDDRLALLGNKPGAENFGEDVQGTRTRYATPGTRTGRGTVRKVSAAQVKFMKRLIAERDTTNLVRLPGSEDIENMSLKGATDLIERLLACPMKAVAQRPAQEMWTEAQKNFITTLVAQKGADSIEGYTPTKREASAIIERLKSLPNAPRPVVATPAKAAASGAITEDGMYLKDGVIYKVQIAHHGSGNLYAKKFDTETNSFEYAPGAVRKLTPTDKMSREQAGEYGKLYGICMRCSRTLTDEYSIANGYGKVCAGKL